MSDFEIDFEQPVGEYEFQPASAHAMQKFRSKKLKGVLRDEIPDEDLPWRLGHLVRKSGGKRARPTARQMESAVNLLVTGEWSRLPIRAVQIARHMGGMLNQQKFESLELWYVKAWFLREMFNNPNWGSEYAQGIGQYCPPGGQLVGHVGVFLFPDGNGGRRLSLRPTGLGDALTLSAARMIATGTTFNICEHCKAPFLGGGAGRGRNKKRADARFCSDACRWGYHNASRRKIRSIPKS